MTNVLFIKENGDNVNLVLDDRPMQDDTILIRFNSDMYPITYRITKCHHVTLWDRHELKDMGISMVCTVQEN